MSFFMLEEFVCRCKSRHCEGKLPRLRMNPLLLQALNRVREEFGAPIRITSGYRCQAHNKAVGGVASSQHLAGTAADISPVSGKPEDVRRLLELCHAERGFTAVGDGTDRLFVHVDVRTARPGTPQKRWDYTK